MSEAISQSVMQYLAFDHANVGYVIDGLEDATVRYKLEREFEAGDLIELKTPEGNVFGYAEVEDVYQSAVSHVCFDLGVDDRAHPADDTFDLLQQLREHYTLNISADSEVTVIYFDVLSIGQRPIGGEEGA